MSLVDTVKKEKDLKKVKINIVLLPSISLSFVLGGMK